MTPTLLKEATQMRKRTLSAAALAAFVSSAAIGYGIHTTQKVDQVAVGLPEGSLASTIVSSSSELDSSGTATAVASSSKSVESQTTMTVPSGYADGMYTGDAVDTRYGAVQVQVVIENGELADVQFLCYPSKDRESAQINRQATVALVQEAIQVQSAEVQVVSGATFTSVAFMESLDSALTQAL
jgi:uncharacterized protein with FMN-binding domain